MTDLTLGNVLYAPFCITVHGHLGSNHLFLGVIFTVYLSARVLCVVSWWNSMTSFDEYVADSNHVCPKI